MALPGTEKKLLVLCKRARKRQPLFHSLDSPVPMGLSLRDQGPRTPRGSLTEEEQYKAFLEAFQRQRDNEDT